VNEAEGNVGGIGLQNGVPEMLRCEVGKNAWVTEVNAGLSVGSSIISFIVTRLTMGGIGAVPIVMLTPRY